MSWIPDVTSSSVWHPASLSGPAETICNRARSTIFDRGHCTFLGHVVLVSKLGNFSSHRVSTITGAPCHGGRGFDSGLRTGSLRLSVWVGSDRVGHVPPAHCAERPGSRGYPKVSGFTCMSKLPITPARYSTLWGTPSGVRTCHPYRRLAAEVRLGRTAATVTGSLAETAVAARVCLRMYCRRVTAAGRAHVVGVVRGFGCA